jgi:hypothetical protein
MLYPTSNVPGSVALAKNARGRHVGALVEDFWDSVSMDEAQFVQVIMAELHDPAMGSAELLAGICDNGGVVQAKKDRMFELRFGYAPEPRVPSRRAQAVEFVRTARVSASTPSGAHALARVFPCLVKQAEDHSRAKSHHKGGATL